jgi:hypothetical protein
MRIEMVAGYPFPVACFSSLTGNWKLATGNRTVNFPFTFSPLLLEYLFGYHRFNFFRFKGGKA